MKPPPKPDVKRGPSTMEEMTAWRKMIAEKKAFQNPPTTDLEKRKAGSSKTRKHEATSEPASEPVKKPAHGKTKKRVTAKPDDEETDDEEVAANIIDAPPVESSKSVKNKDKKKENVVTLKLELRIIIEEGS